MYICLRSKFVNYLLSSFTRQAHLKIPADGTESKDRNVFHHKVDHTDKSPMTDLNNNSDEIIVLKKDTRFMQRKQKRRETNSLLIKNDSHKELPDKEPFKKIEKVVLLSVTVVLIILACKGKKHVLKYLAFVVLIPCTVVLEIIMSLEYDKTMCIVKLYRRSNGEAL